ncbi:MAG: hypothetical protein IJ735_04935 [Clostridia bacterium]|nr:hypothetical protein [Clostridia bacterium]
MNSEHSDKENVSGVARPTRREKAPIFTALITVPTTTVAAILLLAFCLATLAGGLASFAGLAYAVTAPFFAGRTGASGVFVQIGVGLTVCGLGLIVFSAFLLLTRYSAAFSLRLFRYVNGR